MVDFESPLFIRLAAKQSIVLERMLSNPSRFRPEAIKLAVYILEKRKESPDYDSYSLYDLIDARNHINEEKFPVRTHYLDLQISARKRKDHETSKEDKNKAQRDAIKINPRLSVTIKKGGNKPDEETEISLEDFKGFLLEPSYSQYLKIEDSTTELFIMYDPGKTQHGYYFEYFDKYTELEYRSQLHGLSIEFTIRFLKDFLEKGKSSFKEIDWVQIKSKSIFSLIFSLTPIALLFVLGISYKFKIDPLYELIIVYKSAFIQPLLYFILALSILKTFKDRNQLKNLSKLTGLEKYDTITNLFVPFIIAALIYFGLFES